MNSEMFVYEDDSSYEMNKINFLTQASFEVSEARKCGFPEKDFDAKRIEKRFDFLFSHKKIN